MAPPPPEDLVIYEVRGEWTGSDRPELGIGFLGFWVEAGYTFFFFDREPDCMDEPFFKAYPHLELRWVHKMKYREWQDGAGFQPFRVGPVRIVPAWDENEEVEGDGGTIRIDPGLAFGFGGHPTTKACLSALVRIYQEDRPLTVLDLGTGSGILALVALHLGAESVKAVDYSHLAVDTAFRNAALNQMNGRIEVLRRRAESCAGEPADMVLANLHYQIQMDILNRGGFSDRKWLVLSGMFHSEAKNLEKALGDLDVKLVDRIRDDRWTTLVLKKRE